MKVRVDPYGGLDKRIHVQVGELDLYVDYDDVNGGRASRTPARRPSPTR